MNAITVIGMLARKDAHDFSHLRRLLANGTLAVGMRRALLDVTGALLALGASGRLCLRVTRCV